ncbi:MAG TPA: hypothetical protein VMB50_10215, partial [Myxococcales bacterium]|nr:hypothetical protein [Myxococcales bacterium]
MGKTAVVAVLTLFGSGCCFQGASEPTGTAGGASATTGGTPGTSGAGGGTGGSGTTASGATTGSASASGTSGGACVVGSLVLSPNPVTFGPLASAQSVIAFNIGTSPISIVDVAVSSNGPPTFTVSGLPALPTSLPAGQSLTFTVAHAASESADSGQLVATWSSGAACAPQTASAALLGNPGVGPCSLTVSPAQVTFGEVAAGTTASQVVTLTDVSEVACEISQVAIGGDPTFALATGQPTSFEIAPGASATIGVEFSPANGTPPLLRKGTLTFDTTDPTQGAVSVPLAGYLASVGGFFQGWFKWHGDPQNTGCSVVDTSALVGTVAWQLPIGEPDAGQTYVNSPVMDVSGNVYQMNGEGLLYAVALGGAVRWTLQLNPPGVDTHSATPVILSDGSLHVASGSAALGPNLFWVEPDGSELSSMGWGPPGFESCPNVDSSNDVFLAQQAAGATEPTAYAFSPFDGGLVIAGAVPLPVSAPSGRTGIAVAGDGTTYWANGGQVFALAPVGTPFGPLPTWPDGGVTIAAGATDPEIVGAVNSDLALDLE